MKPLAAPNLFPIFAHQGGWDEALLVAGPLFVVGLLLYLANRRVSDRLAAEAAATTAEGNEVDPEVDSEAESGQ